MTNNINGIDVSECYFYSENNCDVGYLADSYPKNCKKNSDCYFKQLKRLQEENKKLKDENSHKSNLIWYVYHCSKVETIQRLLYEYYECINDDRYNEKRVKKFWDDVFHLQQRKKYKSKYKQALEKTLKILCNGRTFYEGYFDNPNLSRTDEAIKVINEVLK